MQAGTYQAVVYFHGIGEQRRYAEISRFIDALDLYAQEEQRPDDVTGVIRDVTGRFDVERTQPNADDFIGHAEFRHVRSPLGATDCESHRPESYRSSNRFRVYEAYWAPETAEGVPVREVLWWMARNLHRPLRLVFTPWRVHARLRMTFLHELRDEFGDETWTDLARANWAFEGPAARRQKPRGSFRQFHEWLEAEDDKKPALKKAAKRWRRHMLMKAIVFQAVLVTLLVAVALGVVAAVVGVMWILNFVAGESWLTGVLGDRAKPSWPNALAIAGTLLLQVGIRAFLERSFGDVVFWSSYRETSTRFEVRAKMLAVGTATLRQVLSDELCTRVVVVAHSLGCAVAHESLLELGKYNKAHNREFPGRGPIDIGKIDQFVTLGSPIDKLHYFVESHAGGGHRYNRLYEELHGDIGTAPFSSNKKPRIHWINLWSKADVISGPLTSPMSMEHAVIRPIDNVEVRTTVFPDPAMSHSGYFGEEQSVKLLFDVIVRGCYSYRTPRTQQREVAPGDVRDIPDYDAEMVRSLGQDKWCRPIQVAVGAIVWLTAVFWLGSPSRLADAAGWLAAILAIAVVVGAGWGRFGGLANPITPTRR